MRSRLPGIIKRIHELLTGSLLLGIVLLSPEAGWSQTTITIGTGTTTAGNNPVKSNSAYNYTQQIYLSSEIGAAYSGQQITSISFYWSGTGVLTNSTAWVVYLGNTTQTNFTSTTNWIASASMTQVYNGTVALPGAAGWMTITLSTPFTWNGTNLVVAIDENTAGSAGTNALWRYSTTTNNTALYRNNTANIDPAAPGTATARATARPNLQFVITPPCTTPSAQPSALTFSGITTTSLSGSFTAASPASSGYLVIRSSSSTLSSNPVDGTSYTAGSTIGGGTVIQTGLTTSFTQTGLTANTTYYYFVFSYNNTACLGGPKYLTASPLVSNVNTCPLPPASTSCSVISSSQIDASWTASTGAAYYYVVVDQNAIYTGSFSGATVVTAPSTSYSFTSLNSNTTYYVHVAAVNNAWAWSGNTNSSGCTTPCANYSLNVQQGFNAATIPACWTQQYISGTSAVQFVTSSSSPTTTPQEGTYYVYWNSYNYTSGNETRLVSPPITSTGTSSVDVEFNWRNENNSTYSAGAYLNEGVQIQFSTDGSSWVDAGGLIARHDASLASGTSQWNLKTITLPALAGNQSTIYIGFKFHSSYGDNCSMDNIVIKPTPCTPPSTPTATGNSRCGTGIVILSAGGAVAGEVYKWYDSAIAGTLLKTSSNNSDNTYTTPSISATTTYYVTKFVSATSCEGTSRAAVVATINSVPAQPSAITGSTSACAGASLTYSVTNVTGVSFTWSFPSGWVQTSGGTTNSVTVTSAGSGTISVTPSNACGAGIAQTLGVTSTGITPANDFCTNATALIADASAVAGSLDCSGYESPFTAKKDVWYAFTAPCNGTYTIYLSSLPDDKDLYVYSSCGVSTELYSATSTGTTETLTNTFVAGNTYYIRVYDYANTGGSFIIQITNVSAAAATPTNFTGSTSVCQNAQLTYSVDSVTGVTYLWTLPSGWTGSSNVHSINVTVGSTGGSISVTATSICGTSAAVSMNVTVTSLPTNVNAGSDVSICPGNSTQINSSVDPVLACTGASTYSNTTAQSIPDNDLTGITSVINVPASCGNAAQLISVYVNITHTFNADIDIYLKAPDGTQIALAEDKGSSGDNYDCTFITGGAVLPTTAVSITGNYAPQSDFSGLGAGSAAGNWILVVRDDASSDLGTLNSWSISVKTQQSVSPAFSWTPSSGLSATNISNPVANPSSTTTYTCTADVNGCTATDNLVITVNTESSPPTSISGDTAMCNGGSITLTAVGGTDGTSASMQWFTASCGGTAAGSGVSITVTPSVTTTYFVRRSGACNTTSCATTTVSVYPDPSITSQSGSIQECVGGGGTLTISAVNGTPSLTYQWFSNTLNSNTGGSLISGATLATYTPPSVSLGTLYYYCIVSASGLGCGSVVSNAVSVETAPDLWLGTINSKWSNTGNWLCGVPTASTQVVITAGATHMPEVDLSALSPAVCADLTIQASATLSIASDKALTVYGTLTNNSGVSGLLLQSDALGSASLIHQSSGVAATVNRYIKGSAEAWHFVSSPVSNQSISGNWVPSGTYGNGTGYDLYVWNEPSSCWIYRLNTSSTVNWNTVHPSSNFEVGRGYLFSFQTANPTKSYSGLLNNGLQSISLTASSSIDSLKGFNLIGNPYPSAIDWQASSGWTRSNLCPSGSGYDMWIWNDVANNYGVCNSFSGSGTNGVSRYIAPEQGFFVLASTQGTITVNNSVRVHNEASLWKSEQSIPLCMSVRVNSEDGNGFDEAKIQFGSENNNDGAMKLFSRVNSAPSLYLEGSGKPLSIVNLTTPQENPSVALNFNPGISGRFSISCDFDLMDFDLVILEDKLLNKIQDMKINNNYQFDADASDVCKRFVLHFAPGSDNGGGELPAIVYSNENTIFIDLSLVTDQSWVEIFDLSGKLLQRSDLTSESVNTYKLDLSPQVLLVRVFTAKQNKSVKLLIWNQR